MALGLSWAAKLPAVAIGVPGRGRGWVEVNGVDRLQGCIKL